MFRAILSVFLFVVMVHEVSGQPTSPVFEVASVKRIAVLGGLPDGFSMTPRRSGGRLTWTTNRTLLLRYAFQLDGARIVGTGIDDGFYAIEATTDPSATEDQIRLMLQSLLADRFKL